MSGNFKLRCCIIAGFLAADIGLIVGLGLHVSVRDLYKPLGFGLLLTLLSIVYWYRREPTFILVLSVLNHLVLFGWSYMVLLYAGASLGRPLIDDSLVQWDRYMGYHEPAVVDWAHSHPTLDRWLNVAYNSLLIQTGILIAVLGLSGERNQLESFMLRLMVSAIIVALVFLIFPAVGPFQTYGYAPDAGQARYLDHLLHLRSGERLTVTDAEPEGLITFPSFHTTWAILLTAAVVHRRIPLALGLLLNVLVIVSTLTSGWHYLSDVLAGLLVAAATIPITNWLERLLGNQPVSAASESTVSSSGPGSQPVERQHQVGE